MTRESALDACGVTRRYPGLLAVDDLTCTLEPGKVTALLGPSGCGKSTLLRLIAGLEPVDAGRIAIDGVPMSAPGRTVPPEQRGVGLVFQDHALFPHLSVRGNVGFGLSLLPRAERDARVSALMERFQIAHLADAWPHMLSGGEQQRVAIARAMARAPSLLLLDEPFSGLDGALRAAVREQLLADLAATGATVLIVTHEPDEALAIADTLLLMADGKLLQAGPPDRCYARPASLAAARLLGEVVVLDAAVTGGAAHTALGPVPAPALPDGAAQVVLRPHAIALAPGGAAAVVEAASFHGSGYRVRVRLDGRPITLLLDSDPPSPGTTVSLALAGPVSGVFPADGPAAR